MSFFSEAKFHHLALAVRDDVNALTYLSCLGYEAGEKIYDPEQNVYLRLCTAAGQPAVEIVTPGEGKTPLDAILQRQPESIYHSCYEIADITAFLARLEAAKLRLLCVSTPKPAVLFNGRMVSFYYIAGYGLVELLEMAKA